MKGVSTGAIRPLCFFTKRGDSMVCDISAESVTNVIREMFLEANTVLPEDMRALIRRSAAEERSPLGRSVLSEILGNIDLAEREKTPLCQDCGMAVVFLDLGQEVHISGGALEAAVDLGDVDDDAAGEGALLGNLDGLAVEHGLDPAQMAAMVDFLADLLAQPLPRRA